MSSVDRGSPAIELAIDPPIVWMIPSASSARVTVSANAIGSTGMVTTDLSRQSRGRPGERGPSRG